MRYLRSVLATKARIRSSVSGAVQTSSTAASTAGPTRSSRSSAGSRVCRLDSVNTGDGSVARVLRGSDRALEQLLRVDDLVDEPARRAHPAA